MMKNLENFRCILQNCIICHDAVISAGCELKDCLISGNFKVPSGGNLIYLYKINFNNNL